MDEVRGTMDCTVTRKKGLQPDNLPKPSVEETRQTRCTVRKRTVTDYSKLIDYDGNDEIGVNFQTLTKKVKETTNQSITKAIQNQAKNREKPTKEQNQKSHQK